MSVLISALLILGGIFGLLGSLGLLKLRAPMQRLHAPGMAATVGLGAILMAASLSGLGVKYLLILGFLLLTAPLTTLFLAKALRHITTRG